MRRVKIAEFRNRVSSYISRAEGGETITILRRNREVATLRPSQRNRVGGKTLLGCLKGTARASRDIDRARIPESDWFEGD